MSRWDVKQPRGTAADRELAAPPVAIAHMIGTIIGLVLLVALLGVVFYWARILLPVISPILRVLIILLVAIIALYVVVVLLSVAGMHVPVPVNHSSTARQ